MLLENQLVLITGAAKGNGAAIAKGMAAHGAIVVITDIDESAALATASGLRAQGFSAFSYRLDVRDSACCADVIDQVEAEIGTLSVLVNNAGVRPRHTFDSRDRDALWRYAMDVNVDGIRNMTLAALAQLKATQGSVINITSIAAHQASGLSISYSTSKAAAHMLTKVLALELARDGVRVNAIAPGVIETDMTASSRSDPQRRSALLARVPMAKFGKPEDLAGPAIFLASSLSGYMTGSTLAVDGGYLAA
ncbi:SDR family NAD(P)-dependent oxidoreductase [Pusillimonas sp. SM2304]|uniref:SDR family NAD(P)-dependent oxidoreductase n=1 Tax=Pusillimonas sp. SM2304 TaxID=3073241 RepID=UPI002874D577|nr:SDR family NAD(P)-dependent oxidoreductase [Pusillimonas sp. SM2304]MDS1139931.1 SDR family NAD(P)-dependent oxidoreductase [Pusillimonas sp. SM2304]